MPAAMPSIIRTSPLRDQLEEVERELPESDYAVTPKGTVLPHSTRIGGIAGRENPYPQARKRTFTGQKLTLVSEEDVAINKHGTGEPVSVPQPAPPPPTASPSAVESGFQAAPGMPAHDIGRMIADEIGKQMNRLVVSQPAMARIEPIQVQVPVGIEVTFEGKFGRITVPMERVIYNRIVLVLGQRKDSPFRYSPPESEEESFTVNWKDGRETRHVTVKNYGLSFDLDQEIHMLVLLPEA